MSEALKAPNPSITLSISLDQDLRDAILCLPSWFSILHDDLTAIAEKLGAEPQHDTYVAPEKVKPAETPSAETIEAPKVEESAEEEKVEKTITLDEVKALAQKLLQPSLGLKDKVRSLISGYAPKISQLPADKLPEIMTQLQSLEKEAAA